MGIGKLRPGRQPAARSSGARRASDTAAAPSQRRRPAPPLADTCSPPGRQVPQRIGAFVGKRGGGCRERDSVASAVVRTRASGGRFRAGRGSTPGLVEHTHGDVRASVHSSRTVPIHQLVGQDRVAADDRIADAHDVVTRTSSSTTRAVTLPSAMSFSKSSSRRASEMRSGPRPSSPLASRRNPPGGWSAAGIGD